jgi:multimeric flavodoxin WrbA
MLSELQTKYGPETVDLFKFLDSLVGCKKVLFVTTSTRSEYVSDKGEQPKSSQLAFHIQKLLLRKEIEVQIIDGSKLKIHNCLGCVSELMGNQCGVKKSKVKDKTKNPTGNLRCWASHDYDDDELWKLVNPLYESEAIIFFGSQRWGSVNAIYQKIIERLDWIENMHTALGEPSTIKGKKAGLILIGQNWAVSDALRLQQKVLSFFGFETPSDLFIGWQFTRDENDENLKSYEQAPVTFEESWNLELKFPNLKESSVNKIKNLGDFLHHLEKISSI